LGEIDEEKCSPVVFLLVRRGHPLSSGPLPPMRKSTKVFDQIRAEEAWEPKLSTALLETFPFWNDWNDDR